MTTKKKILLFLLCSVAVAALSVLMGSAAVRYISAEPIFEIVILVAFPALLYAIFYEKFDFCRSRFASMFFHSMIWLGLIELYMLFSDLLDDSEEKKHGMTPGLGWYLLIGVGIWWATVCISYVLIAIKNGLRKQREKAENEQMMREIMQRNTESNFKEKNDV